MSVQALNRKEAIASGEDIAPVTREEYYLKGLVEGQGGGLEYVIPEQTVKSGDSLTVNDSALFDREYCIFKIKVAVPGSVDGYYASKYEEDGFDQFNIDGQITITIYKETGWIFESSEDALNYTISAIRGF